MAASAARRLGGAWGWLAAVSGTRSRFGDLGIEDGDPDAVAGQGVAVGVREPADEPGQPEPAQVVGHLPGGVGAAEQPGDQDAEVLVGEAGCGEQGVAEGAGQGHDPRITEPQGRGPPPFCINGGVRDPLKGWARKDGALAGTFGIQYAPVGGAGLAWSSSRLGSGPLAPSVTQGHDPDGDGLLVCDGLRS